MVNEILEMFMERVEAAKKDLERLKILIEVAEEAGEDVTELKIKASELETKIRMWENAIRKRLGGKKK